MIWERCWALFPDASALLYEPPLLALILRNGIIKPGLDWVNDDSLKAIQVFFFSLDLSIPILPMRATNSVVWAKIKNYFQHPPKEHPFLAFLLFIYLFIIRGKKLQDENQ